MNGLQGVSEPHGTPRATASDSSVARRYKACRTCRKQKMRCDGGDGVSCARCLKAGVDCLFDQATAKRRKSTFGDAAHKRKLQTLTDEIVELKAQITSLNHGKSQVDSQHAATQNEPRWTGDAPTSTEGDFESSVHHAFSPDNLKVPVTAVHVMMHPALDGEAERNSAGWTAENQSRWNKEEHNRTGQRDLVARGEVDEGLARRLFERYMHGANIFLPIFDPVLDTFESVRDSSPFSFAVLIYVAARHEYRDEAHHSTLQACKEEVYHFAAESLFENPSSLETTEAMTILANHSEKMWFALGHAYQMSVDLGLDVKLHSLAQASSLASTSAQATKQTRFAVRCARSLLLTVRFERAIAFGTLRESRMREMDTDVMERFLDNPNSHPSDTISCAVIDLVQYLRRIQIRREVPTEATFDDFMKGWLQKWDGRLETNCVHKVSFQRCYVKMQELYARIIYSGMAFAHREKDRHLLETRVATVEQDSARHSRSTVHLIKDLLKYIDDCGSYKSIFSWAPTYDGLLLTFVVILAFQARLRQPASVDLETLLGQVEQAAVLLKQHPCSNFYMVVEATIKRWKSSNQNVQSPLYEENAEAPTFSFLDFDSILQGEHWMYDLTTPAVPGDERLWT